MSIILTTTTNAQIVRTNDVCKDNPCLNAGSCMPNGVGGFFCQCLNGFVGNRCEARGKLEIFSNYKEIMFCFTT